LLKIAAGIVDHDDGKRWIKPGVTMRYLPQEPDLSQFKTSREYIEDGLVGADDSYRIPYLLDGLSLTGDEDPQVMSGGELRRAALARTLAPKPDILMLDEPTNHLDLAAIEWLENEIKSLSSSVIIISHDRRFLENLSKRTLWVDRGETKLLEKNFSFFEDWRDRTLEQEKLDRHKLKQKIHREQHWVIHGVSGRRKRNVKRLKDLSTLRTQFKTQRQSTGNLNITVADSHQSGRFISKLVSITKSFGDKKIFDDFSIKITRGERIGIVGPNGSGKTTLLKIIMGEIRPDKGRVELGVNLLPLIIDQKRESLNDEWTLSEALTDNGGDKVMVGDNSIHVIRYMKDFLFLPEQAKTPLHALSGGERGRLQLARGLRLPSNLLVLDEPTNDLDLETLDLLQELVADYDGTVIVVSHDRDFLDRTVTRTIAYEDDSKWQIYPGGYTDMVNQRGFGVVSTDKKLKYKPHKVKNSPVITKSKNKLTYKDKFRLEQLPQEIQKFQNRISEIELKLTNADFFHKDPDGFNEAIRKLDQYKIKLEKSEEEWLKLELLNET
jgi:ATP-binding cassette subfamily F protein uup